MENETFAPQEQMFHFSYFKKSYISKASKGACEELRINAIETAETNTYLTDLSLHFVLILFLLMIYVPDNKYSVMLEQFPVFISIPIPPLDP